MPNKTIELTNSVLVGAFTFIFAVIGTTTYVTWEIRKDYVDELKLQVGSLEKSASMKLPVALAAIKEASDTLVLNVAEKKELVQLRADVNTFRDRSQKLSVELEDITKKYSSAQEELARILVPTTTIELHAGESKFLIENTINLALVSGINAFSYANIRLANELRNISLGETIEYKAGTKNCQLTLLKGSILSESVSFQNSCS